MAEFGNNNVDLDIWVLFHILKDNLAVFEALGFPNSGLNLRWEDVVIFIFIKLLLMEGVAQINNFLIGKRLYSMDTSAWGRGQNLGALNSDGIFFYNFSKKDVTL